LVLLDKILKRFPIGITDRYHRAADLDFSFVNNIDGFERDYEGMMDPDKFISR
jgi:hypothetical protein